jgi:putative acetyltransferase
LIELRPEQTGDWKSIHEITELAFAGKSYSDGDEQDLIDNLRDQGVLTLSLVAVDKDKVVGQITFSPATIESNSGPWFALGPVSVRPDRQGEGIGSLLINTGLLELEKRHALGCILTGNPAYYQRFGFELSPSSCPTNEPQEYFMVKQLSTEYPVGRFAFHETFYEGT